MTAGNHHRIQRQVLELDLLSPPGAAPALQEQAARPFRERALPMLEELFDRVAGPGRLVRLERLEVDLGELRGRNWPDQLLERLTERLRAALPAPLRTEADEAAPPAPPNAAEAWFEQLLFFLAHGRLPWWGERPRGAWAEGPRVLGRDQWRALGDLLVSERRAGPRLIESVGDGFLAQTVAALADLPAADEVLLLLAPRGEAPSRAAASWRRSFWMRVLEFGLGGLDSHSGGRLMRRLLADRAVVERAGGPASGRVTLEPPVGRGPVGLPILPPPWQAWREAVAASAEASGSASVADAGGRTDGEGGPERRHEGAAPEPTSTRVPTDGPISASLPPAPSQSRESALPEAPAREAGAGPLVGPGPGLPGVDGELVLVPGAGAVILHPFLGELFRSRGLLRGSRFRDDPSRRRAVHLLGHLTFGHEGAEYDLLLAKLLCGMAWEELLPPSELEDEDRQACDELLAAVLGHWRALKSHSADWLREQFFLREGTLEAVDDGWRLTVEGRAQDVLLTRLPWGLGVIRLPWLPGVLHVHWTD